MMTLLIQLILGEASVSVTALLGILAAVGGLGGIATLLLAPRQGRSIAVQASESAVRAVNDAMANLRLELELAQKELSEAQKELAEARNEREELIERVSGLQKNVDDLSKRLQHYQEHLDKGEMPPPYEGPDRRKEDDTSYSGPERRLSRKRRGK